MFQDTNEVREAHFTTQLIFSWSCLCHPHSAEAGLLNTEEIERQKESEDDRESEREKTRRGDDRRVFVSFSCHVSVWLRGVVWCGGEWRGCGFGVRCAFHCFHKSNEEGQSSEWLT